MIRKLSLLSLLVALVSVSFLAGCTATSGDKPNSLSGQQPIRHTDKGFPVYK